MALPPVALPPVALPPVALPPVAPPTFPEPAFPASSGLLLSPPHAYRSERTAGWRAVVERIGERRLYETTGIQLMQINTIFQLAVHDR